MTGGGSRPAPDRRRTPDARFEFSEAKYSYGWSGKIVQKGTFEAGFGDKAPGREVIGLTIHPEDGDDDMLSIRMEGADVMHLNGTDIPYTLALRRVK